eukprot:664972_1
MSTFFTLSIVAIMTFKTGSFEYDDQITINMDTKTFLLRGSNSDKIVHRSSLGLTRLIMQSDGNLVLNFGPDATTLKSLWSTKTNSAIPKGDYMQLTSNGNLQVIGEGQITAVWESGIRGYDNRLPHTLVVTDRCAYIMDRDSNIFWTSSIESGSETNCSLYALDLVIQKSNETRPISPVFNTSLYGASTFRTTHLNQGRINAIYDWGITLRSINNTLYIRNWDADQQNIADGAMSSMGGPAGSMYPIACDPFVLNDGDYIIGYNIYDSVDFVHGITFYTSLGCAYECIGEADTGHRGGKNIVNRGIISYYYAVDEFWYLSGFSGFFGAVIDSLQLQFTQLPSGTNLSTSESDTFMCARDLTMSPTNLPSVHPTPSPTSHPTNKPSVNPTLGPSNNPSVNPTNKPSPNPTLNITNPPSYSLKPSVALTWNPSRGTTVNPSFGPTTNPSDINERRVDITTSLVITKVELHITDDAPEPGFKLLHNTSKYAIFVTIFVVIVCVGCAIVMVTYIQKNKAETTQHSDDGSVFASSGDETYSQTISSRPSKRYKYYCCGWSLK